MSNPAPLFCARCAAELTPGAGTFYCVVIEAFADPTAPEVSDDDLDAEAIERRLAQLYEQLQDISAQEALDQVHRRLTLHLCGPCYRGWIENPTGSGEW
jgi:hypothetical protein